MPEEKKEAAPKAVGFQKLDEAWAEYIRVHLPSLGKELVVKGISPVANGDVHAGN